MKNPTTKRPICVKCLGDVCEKLSDEDDSLSPRDLVLKAQLTMLKMNAIENGYPEAATYGKLLCAFDFEPNGEKMADKTTLDEQILTALKGINGTAFNESSPQPLSLKIHEEIVLELTELSVRRVKRFLKWWCDRNEYHFAVIADGARRYSLNGNKTFPVEQNGKDWSIKMLNKRRGVMS
jgi:hypothetical protein